MSITEFGQAADSSWIGLTALENDHRLFLFPSMSTLYSFARQTVAAKCPCMYLPEIQQTQVVLGVLTKGIVGRPPWCLLYTHNYLDFDFA